jgi:hypothetical protein
MRGFKMLASIQLNNQLRCRAIKIHNEFEQWFLSIELHAMNLFAANVIPQHLLSIGHIGSMLAQNDNVPFLQSRNVLFGNNLAV